MAERDESSKRPCPHCAGTGMPCQICGGTGKAKPPKHECRYGGVTAMQLDDLNGNEYAKTRYYAKTKCGSRGWLCDRCQQDRADARAGVSKAMAVMGQFNTLDRRLEDLETKLAARCAEGDKAMERLEALERCSVTLGEQMDRRCHEDDLLNERLNGLEDAIRQPRGESEDHQQGRSDTRETI